ncbi:hypothetical protein [Campylobacter sp.]|uniref:hypothetical protein n=1 Tax=Campylobacter sp. TaxID=205 RepID=UPI002AA85410|nr:hypothetical protein [Campylobacter sp.]MCI7237843.1 hypothetical protein [Campylobacter sp.]
MIFLIIMFMFMFVSFFVLFAYLYAYVLFGVLNLSKNLSVKISFLVFYAIFTLIILYVGFGATLVLAVPVIILFILILKRKQCFTKIKANNGKRRSFDSKCVSFGHYLAA